MIINSTKTITGQFSGQRYFFEYHNPTGRSAKLVYKTPLGEYEFIDMASPNGWIHNNIIFPTGEFTVKLDDTETGDVYVNWERMPED